MTVAETAHGSSHRDAVPMSNALERTKSKPLERAKSKASSRPATRDKNDPSVPLSPRRIPFPPNTVPVTPSSNFAPEELASLDAVREDAVCRFTRALAPKLGEKTYGHSEREAEANASIRRGSVVLGDTSMHATTGVGGSAMGSIGENTNQYAGNGADAFNPNQVSMVNDVLQPTDDQPNHAIMDSFQARVVTKTDIAATAKVGRAALEHEFRKQTKAYIEMRERELLRSAKARTAAADAKAKAQKAKVEEEHKKNSRGLGKVNVVKFGDEEIDLVAEGKKKEAAKRALDRQRDAEVLEARLFAWPVAKVLLAVETAFLECLTERRRAAGLDQENELFDLGAGAGTEGNESRRQVKTQTDDALHKGSANSGDPADADAPGMEKRESVTRGARHTNVVAGSRGLPSSTSVADTATLRGYKKACESLGVTPNTVAIHGLLSQSGIVDVSGASLGDASCVAIAMTLRHAPNATQLDLDDNDITSGGLLRITEDGLATLSPSGGCALGSIAFSKNSQIGNSRIGPLALADWFSSANVPASLHTVRLSRCGIYDSEGAVLVNALSKVTGLTVLDLSGNKLGNRAAAALGHFFAHSKCRDANFSGNGFAARDGEVIGLALGAGMSESLSTTLEKTPVPTMKRVKSAASLSREKSLSKPGTTPQKSGSAKTAVCRVRFLNLANNGFADAGCFFLVASLAKNQSLETLNLANTRFGSASAAALHKSLTNNSTLRSITLDGNQLGADSQSVLLAALDRSRAAKKNLTEVSLTNTRTEDADSEAKKQREARFLTEQPVKKKGKGKAKGGAKKGGGKKKTDPAVPTLRLQMATSKPSTFRAFTPSRPEGRYVFDLAGAGQRQIAQSLFELDLERRSDDVAQRIVNLTVDSWPVLEDPVTLRWPSALPKRGVLKFDFTQVGAQTGAEAGVTAEGEETNPQTVCTYEETQESFAQTLRDVGCARLTPRERREALEHARRGRVFTPHQASVLIDTFDVGDSRVDAAAALVPRLRLPEGEEVSSTSSSSLAASIQRVTLAKLTSGEQSTFFTRFGKAHVRYLPFFKEHPSGRYELDLRLRCDRAVVSALAQIASRDLDFENFRDVAMWSDKQCEKSVQNGTDSLAFLNLGDPKKPPGPPPNEGVLSFEFVKKPAQWLDATGAFADGAKRLRATEALAIQKGLRKHARGAQSFGYFAGSSADVLVSYKKQLLSVSGPGTGRTTTCAFVGCFVDASNDSATRIEIAVSSRDACVDVQENWIQIIDKLHGDEQSAVCSRVGHWPLVDVAKGIAQHARSERKALRTLARRDARLKEEKEIAETKAREAFEAAERKQKRDKEKAEKAALNSKKKKGTSSKAGSTAGDTSVAASVIDGGETDSVMGEQLGDPSQTDPGAVPMELSVPKGDVQVTKNHGDMAEGDETPVAEGEEEAVSPEISVDESSLKKSEGVPLTETTTAEDEIDEEDGQALDVGEPDLRPASMRYILTCSDPKQAQVFRDVLNAASAAPTKWRSIRNFRVGGVLRDDLVTPRERVVPSVDTAVDTGNRIKVDTDDTTPSKEVVPVDYGKVFNLCKEFCDSFPVVRDVCVVESVVSLGIAALVQEAKETEDETERVRVLAVKTGLKKNRDNAESEDDEHENDADLNLDTPRTPTATPKPLQKRLTDYSFEKEIKVGVQFVVEFDFFGLDFFDRLNGVEFIENGFLRDLFLENKARGTEADRTRTRHAFHLREMQWEAAIFEAFEFSQKTEREKEDAEVAEKAAGAAADDEDKRIDETSNGAEPSPPDTSSPATPVGVVGIPVLSPIQVPGVTDQTRASTPFAETETKIDGKKPFALLTTTPKTPALWRKLRTKKQILVGSGGSSVFVAGPVFTPSDSAWWCPAQPGVCATLDENSASFQKATTDRAYAVDPHLVRSSLDDKTPVYEKTWHRYQHTLVRLERDAALYAANVSVVFSDSLLVGGASATNDAPVQSRAGGNNTAPGASRDTAHTASLNKLQRHHACPLREIWRVIRKDVFAANVSGVSLRVEKNGGLIENATTASARVSHSEQLIANAKRDPRLNEALLADPVDQSMIATLEAELGGILAPIEDALEKAQAAAAATHALAATALAENVLFEKKLQSLQLEGPFSEHDSVYPASSVNFALKRITGGVGFHETLIKTCCGLTEECAEAVATFELELNEFHENKNQEVVPAKAPAGSVDSTPPPPATKPPQRPDDERLVTWRAFETMFLWTDFSRSANGGGTGNDAWKENENVPVAGLDAVALAVKSERLEARATAAKRNEAARARAVSSAKRAAAARAEETGEDVTSVGVGVDSVDPVDATAPGQVEQLVDDFHDEAGLREPIDSGCQPIARPRHEPVRGLPRITPRMLTEFVENRDEATRLATLKKRAEQTKALAKKPAKGKKAPSSGKDKKNGEDAKEKVEETSKPKPHTRRGAAGEHAGDDLLKAAAGVDPRPPDVVVEVVEEDPKGKKK